MQTVTDYWFFLEPYVFVGLTNKNVLLYNTLDGTSLESNQEDVIELLRETLQEEICGVVLLTSERYNKKNINNFIHKIRDKFMGDVIDISLSKGKPIQLLPYFNFPNKHELYKRHNFSPFKNVLENLYEISIHVDVTTNVTKLISFLQSVPGNPTFNIIGKIKDVASYAKLLTFFNQRHSPKNLFCSYENIIVLQPLFENNFSYIISVCFPINMKQWDHSINMLLNQTLSIEYVFDVTSEKDIIQVEKMVEQYQIEKYKVNPVYTRDNISFFQDYVFLSKEDILSTPMTIKDFFSRQAMNIYDFGKINIMPNGDAYANLNFPTLGNIYTNNIYEIVHKEIVEGKSWFRIRNQAPCNDCIYQWLCPPPSNFEITIGRPNLCHVKPY